MPPLPRPRAILFDLDDTITVRHAALERFAARFSQDFASHLPPLEVPSLVAAIESVDAHGYRPRPEFVALLGRVLPWARTPNEGALLAYWQSVFPQCCTARAGTRQVLDWLQARGISLGLITNGGEAVQQAKVNALGIRSAFATIIISTAVGVEKPDPRIFQLALASIDVAPEQAWYIGDHPHNDVWGAVQVGMTSLWLPGPLAWPAGEAPPDRQIAELTDVIDLVRLADIPRDHTRQ